MVIVLMVMEAEQMFSFEFARTILVFCSSRLVGRYAEYCALVPAFDKSIQTSFVVLKAEFIVKIVVVCCSGKN